MADVRCPMCGKPNPEANAECQHCGSRLKPLILSEEPAAEPRPPAGSGDVTLLRRALRDLPEPAEEEEEEAQAEPPRSADVTLMRRALRGYSPPPAASETEEQAEEEPPPPAASADVTLLRSSLRAAWDAPAQAEPEEPPAASPASDPEDTPAWLQRLRAQTGSAPLRSAPPRQKAGPEPPPGDAPQQAKPPEAGRRRTTDELLRSLRTTARASQPEAEPPAAGGAEDDIPDWLGALRRQSVAHPEPEPPPPAAASPGEAEPTAEPGAAAGMPDWLRSLREQALPEGESAEPDAPAPESALQAPPAASAQSGAPAWLEQPQTWEADQESGTPPPIPPESAEPADDFPDWLKTLKPVGAEAPAAETVGGMPDWLQALEARQEEEQQATTETGPAAVPDWLDTLPPVAAPESEVTAAAPDWLTSPEGPAAEPAPAPGDLPDWLKALQDAAPAEPLPAEPSAALPDWLDSLPPLALDAADPAAPPTAAPPAGGAETALPDWLASLAVDKPGPPAPAEPGDISPLPDWLASLSGEEPGPQAPAEPVDIPPAEPEDKSAPPLEPVEAREPIAHAPAAEPAGDLPDWLLAMRSAEAEGGAEADAPASVPPFVAGASPEAALDALPAAPAPSLPGDLERATLPAWLEAMRPLPISQPGAAAGVEYEETTGPLAGMKGVIAAEPAIALPTGRSGLAAAAEPAVSETHLAQARLLQALVREETASRAAPRAPGARPILSLLERWLVFAVLAAAVLAPFVLTDVMPAFGPPSLFPVETVAARDLVATLPAGRPVLVVFEYEPGVAGEMDSLARALLAHLAGRGLGVAALSTRPLGPALAQAALESVLPPDAQYVNLGYLPGGAVALPAFAADPRSQLPGGFSIGAPGAEGSLPEIWQGPVLADVRSLADFGMIAVVSSSPEAVRVWIEQARVFRRASAAGGLHPPMIALVSAAAEPLVQPYYLAEDADSSLQGLVAGQFGAVAYEQLAGGAALSTQSAAQRWNAQALGLIAAILLIGAGALVFGSFGLLQRRGERTS